jgi:glycosyltransferase involved in cell wall biosynthesis
MKQKIFIIIPAWNEERSIGGVIHDLQENGYQNIVVVDDGSSDETGRVAKQAGAVVLRHVINRGQGTALKTGMEYALRYGADIIVHFDADGQMRVENIPKIIKPIINGEVEVTLGSRFLNKGQKIPLLKKWLILKPAIFLDHLLTGLKITDTHNGFRALSRVASQKIDITIDGFAHASEILAEIARHKIKYQEVPVAIDYHEFGQGFSGGLKILKDLFFKRIF